MGILGAAFGMGVIFGPPVGGFDRGSLFGTARSTQGDGFL